MTLEERSEDWTWGMDETLFPDPSSDVESWEFFVPTSNDEGEGINIHARMEPKTIREIDKLIMKARTLGYDSVLQTRSDFIRWAVFRGYKTLGHHLDVKEEEFQHNLLLLQEGMRQARESALIAEVKRTVMDMIRGFDTLIQYEAHQEARTRLTDFLANIMKLTDDARFIKELYIRSLFGVKIFQEGLDQLDKAKLTSPTIENAKKAWERIGRES